MARLVFDLEANGLLDEATTIHCLVIKDLDTAHVGKFGPSEIELGIECLLEADLIVGHNVIGYDLQVITKLYPWANFDWSKVRDTLVLSRLLYADLSDSDYSRGALREANLMGSHSLKAWGLRLGFQKLDYSGGWEQFSETMLEYCTVDVEVTERLWKRIESESPPPIAVELEHQVAEICARQERYGWSFDEAKAERLARELMARRVELEAELQDTFKPFYLPNGPLVSPKKNMTRKGVEYTEGAQYQKIKLTVFNPGSRAHIANRLKFLYGWEPTEFTDGGSAKVDETVLGKLEWPEAKLLTEYFLVQKRLGMVVEGDKAWLKLVRNGKLHGEVITNGAVTGRATHRNPNLAQVPAVRALYGDRCRELFHVPSGKRQVGIDLSGIELRMLAHYMARFDGGAYGEIVCHGDVHTANQRAAELPTRDNAKTFIYAFLYGAGNWKIGHIVAPTSSDKEKERVGKKLKASFLDKTPGLKKLVDGVIAKAEAAGYLVGLDGRQLRIRSSHAALNTLLQSAGALIAKRWLVEIDLEIKRKGWAERAHQLGWIHDEVQFEVDQDIAEEFGKMAVECISRAAKFFNIRVPLTGEYKIGANWKECH